MPRLKIMNIDKLPQSDELSSSEFLRRSTAQETQNDNDFILANTMPAGNIEPSSLSLGQWLKQTRIAQHLAPNDVANRLNVGTQIVRDIENDAFDQVGAPVFVRNYLSRYADLLRLPEQEVLQRYKELGIDQPPPLKVSRPVTPTAQAGNLRWLTYPLMFAVVIWLGWLGIDRLSSRISLFSGPDVATAPAENTVFALPGQAPATTPANAQQNEQNIALIDTTNTNTNTLTETLTPAIAANNAATSQSSQAPLPAAITALPSDSSAVNNPTLTVAESTTAIDKQTLTESLSEPNTTLAATTTIIDPENHQLLLQVSADCWVEIKDANGQRLLYGTVKANSQRTLAGRAPFSITLGNSTAAQLSLNGQPVDTTLYQKPGGVSKFVLAADAPING